MQTFAINFAWREWHRTRTHRAEIMWNETEQIWGRKGQNMQLFLFWKYFKCGAPGQRSCCALKIAALLPQQWRFSHTCTHICNPSRIHEWMFNSRPSAFLSFISLQQEKSENSSSAYRRTTNTHYSHTTLITLGCLPMAWLYGTVWALNRSSISHRQSVTALFQPPCH